MRPPSPSPSPTPSRVGEAAESLAVEECEGETRPPPGRDALELSLVVWGSTVTGAAPDEEDPGRGWKAEAGGGATGAAEACGGGRGAWGGGGEYL